MDTIILLSGGIDSTVILAMEKAAGKNCLALTFNYGQRQKIEIESAKKIASHYDCNHLIIPIDSKVFSTSALLTGISVPRNRTIDEIENAKIPTTYVPARNTIFLSYALGIAEIYNAKEIHYGANAHDQTPYPDCRPIFFEAFQNLMNYATKQAVEGSPPQLITPLSSFTKKQIILKGKSLNAPLDLTFSCYDPIEDTLPCEKCDACLLKAIGYKG